MSNRKLSVLGIIAVLMAGWAVLQNRISQNVNVADFSSSPLIEGLQTEAISTITLATDEGEIKTTLKRTPAGFVVSDKDNYPADISKINRLLNNCLDIRTHEKVTDNPDNHADLKVTDETARYRIAFLDEEDKDIVGIFVSESNEKGEAFARLLSGNEVYSIQSLSGILPRAIDYVDVQLLQIEQKQIASVGVRTGADSYVLNVSADKSSIELQDMPIGKQYKGTNYKSVFEALISLQFEDVISVSNASKELVFNSTCTCKLDDQTVYKLTMAQMDEKTYAKISADYLDKSRVEISKDDSQEKLKEKEAKLLAMDAAKAFTQKHQGWIYQIPSYQADDLTMPLSELLEDVPQPDSEEESQEALPGEEPQAG